MQPKAVRHNRRDEQRICREFEQTATGFPKDASGLTHCLERATHDIETAQLVTVPVKRFTHRPILWPVKLFSRVVEGKFCHRLAGGLEAAHKICETKKMDHVSFADDYRSWYAHAETSERSQCNATEGTRSIYGPKLSQFHLAGFELRF